MKKILLILLLFTASLTAQVGTGNITLDEVLDEIYGNVDHTGKSLVDCITYANTNGGWNATYSGSKNSLLNFRGYASVSFITLSTTSTLAAWSPTSISSGSETLEWSVGGAVNIPVTVIDIPTFDFSPAGTKNILIENTFSLQTISVSGKSVTSIDVSNSTYLSTLIVFSNLLTSLDVSKNTRLQTLSCSYNNLGVLNVRQNRELIHLYCISNSIPNLDIGLNNLLSTLKCYGNNQSPSVTDKIFTDLDANGIINGTLNIRNNRTSASDTARANLITKGWTITDTYTT